MSIETFDADSEEPVFMQVTSDDDWSDRYELPVIISNEMQTPLQIQLYEYLYYEAFIITIYTESRVLPRSVDIVFVILSTDQEYLSTAFAQQFCTSLMTGKSEKPVKLAQRFLRLFCVP